MKIQYLLKTGLVAGVVVAIINVTIYLISKSAGIISDNILLAGGEPLTLVPVVISSLLPGIFTSLLLWAISKYSGNPVRVICSRGMEGSKIMIFRKMMLSGSQMKTF